MDGYLQQMAVPDYGPNPWAQATTDANNQLQNSSYQSAIGIPQGQWNIQNQQGQMDSFAKSSGVGYPTFPNSAGIGSQVPFAAPQQQQQPAQSPITADSGSRGFTPWSLSGEALSR
jgi:hypothetical protein